MANFPQVKVSSCHGFLGRKVCQGLALPALTMMPRQPPPPIRKVCQGLALPALTMMPRQPPPPIMKVVRCSSSLSLVHKEVSASSLHTSTPWLMLPPETDPLTGRKVDRFYSMTDRQLFKLDRKKSLGVPEDARCFGSSRGWIGFIDPNDCSLYLSNPFSDALCVHPLPSIESLPSVLGVKRKPPYSNNNVDKFIMFPYSKNKEENSDLHISYEGAEEVSESIVKHLSLSCCDPFNDENNLVEDCIAMVVQGEKQEVSFCRVGKEETWTTLMGSSASYPQTVCPIIKGSDVQLFYTMFSDRTGCGIDAWEIPKPWRIPARFASFVYESYKKKLHKEFKFETTSEYNLRNRCGAKDYLAVDESSGDIMLIIRYTDYHVAEDDQYKTSPHLQYKTLRFDVYKVDMRKQKLECVQDLGNRAILLGSNQSFTLSTCEFPGLRKNSIYFTDDCEKYLEWNRTYGGYDLGIYNLEDNSIEPCYPFPDDLKDMKSNPILLWVAPNSYC